MVTQAGLTGRGGAAFPTGTRMRSVAMRRGPKFVLANGMEDEPASEKDQALLARAPHLVLDGTVLVASAADADAVARLARLAGRRPKNEWAILGLNQWPLPCQGSALPLS